MTTSPTCTSAGKKGERNATRLLKEITALGYRGSYGALSAYLRPMPPGPGHHRPAIGPQGHRLDHHPPRPARRTTATPAQSGPEPVPRAGHPRHTRPCLRRHPHPASRPEPPAWISAVRADDLPSLHGFAGGLERDLDAVTTGLTLAWNSGPIEGHVNRIIMWNQRCQAVGVLSPAIRGGARGRRATRVGCRRFLFWRR